MSNKGEIITEERIGFEKSNKALGCLYKEWYELISKQLSEIYDAYLAARKYLSRENIVILKCTSSKNGGGGIRTHGTLADTLVFKTRALNHSTTPPGKKYSTFSF